MMSKLPLTLVFASMLAATSAFAKTFKLPDDKPVVSLTIPDSWKPEEIDKGVQGQTEDSTVFLSAETTKNKEDMGTIVDETFAMLKEHKVALNNDSKKENKFDINGLPADELLFSGKDEDGPTSVSITFVTVNDTILVFTYWASPDGEKKHQKEIASLVQSVEAIK